MGGATDGNVVHGQLYRVLETEPATLHSIDTEETVLLTDPRTVKPTHCLCYYSAQGRTVRGILCLVGSHQTINTAASLVGLSRQPLQSALALSDSKM